MKVNPPKYKLYTTNDANAFSVLCTCFTCRNAGYVIVGKSTCVKKLIVSDTGAKVLVDYWLPHWTFPITPSEAYAKLVENHSANAGRQILHPCHKFEPCLAHNTTGDECRCSQCNPESSHDNA